MRSLIDRLKRNPDYAGAVAVGYVYMTLHLVAQALLAPLYLKYLGPYQFGVLMMLLTFVTYAPIGISWMTGGVLRVLGEAVAREAHDEFAQVYALAKLVFLGYVVLAALAIAAAGFLFDSSLFPGVPDQHRQAVQWSCVFAGLYLVVLYDMHVDRLALVARKQQALAGLFQIISLVVFISGVIPWLISGGGLPGVLALLLAGVVVARIASLLYWRIRKVDVGWRKPVPEMKPLLARLTGAMGRGYFMYGAFQLTMQADVLLVGFLGGAKLAGTYALAWKLADFLVQIIWRASEYLQPYLIQWDARDEHVQIRQLFRRGYALLAAISAVAGLAYALFGQWLVRFWVGPEHAPKEALAFWLAGAAIFWLGSARLPAMVAYSTLKLRPLNIVAGMELGGKLLITLLLFGRLGYIAPLAALSIVHVLGVALLYFRLAPRERAI